MRRARIAAVLIGGSLLVLAARPLVLPRAADEAGIVAARTETHEFWARYRDATDKRGSGDCERAVAAYLEALAIRPAHEDSLYYLGNCQLELGAYGNALEAYRRLTAVNPEGSSRGYMQRGLVHASLESGAPFDLDEAERMFQRALDVDPDSGAMLGLAEVALLRGDRDVARRRLLALDAENPMSIAAPYLLGALAWKRGERPEAWRLFRTAVARGELKKPVVKWTEEGDVKADPALRWRALARQSVFGAHWIRVRAYLTPTGPAPADMDREYRRLEAALASRAR
jgi:tetratricopeptide (TPR) repeat protein